MKKIVLLIMACFVMFSTTGCATYLTKQAWNDAQEQRAVRVESDGSQVMVGLDVTTLTYLKKNWPMALLAGVVDAGLVYGAYVAVEELEGGDSGESDSTSVSSAGRDTTTINVEGDGNTVQVRGDESTVGTGL